MGEHIKCKKALEYIIDGYEVKMITTDFKGNVFIKNKREGKPIMWTVIKSTGNNIIRFLTYDEFKERFKDNFFYKVD